MCMCVCLYIRTHTQTHAHARKHAHTRVNAHTHNYVCIFCGNTSASRIVLYRLKALIYFSIYKADLKKTVCRLLSEQTVFEEGILIRKKTEKNNNDENSGLIANVIMYMSKYVKQRRIV